MTQCYNPIPESPSEALGCGSVEPAQFVQSSNFYPQYPPNKGTKAVIRSHPQPCLVQSSALNSINTCFVD